MINKDIFDCLRDIIESERLPNDAKFLADYFHSDGNFYADENVMFDYKEVAPYSFSDEYFTGLIKLLCAFHNAYGGVILFGVRDHNNLKLRESRAAGKNKVVVNEENFNSKLLETLDYNFTVKKKSYLTPTGEVTALLIPKRHTSEPPVRVTKNYPKFGPNHIFFREGPTVKTALSSHNKFLYGARQFGVTNDTEEALQANLPTNPFTVAKFVGRAPVLSRLFKWLTKERSIPFYLYGDGGSGKSCVAYEFADVIAQVGSVIKISGKDTFDSVIYLSAKEKFLDTSTGSIKSVESRDFTNSDELFHKLLTSTNFLKNEDIENKDDEEIIQSLEELFNNGTCLIVIDDIDTLSNAGVDTGISQLSEIIAASESKSKILLTQRSQPSGQVRNSFEVPGLDEVFELPIFINECVQQFNVVKPNLEEIGKIVNKTACKPLGLETIFQFRRISDSYDEAIEMFDSDQNDVKEYLYQREYDRITNTRSKRVLAALSIMNKSVTKDQLLQLTNMSSAEFKDGITPLESVFLKLIQRSENDDLYSLSEPARPFLKIKANDFPETAALSARKQSIEQGSQLTPVVSRIVRDSGLLRKNREYIAAYEKLTSKALPVNVTEDKFFVGELAIVSSYIPGKTSEARERFHQAFSMGNREHWVFVELCLFNKRNQDDLASLPICEKFIKSKTIEPKTRQSAQKTKAIIHKQRGDFYLEGNDLSRAMTQYFLSTSSNIERYLEIKRVEEPNSISYLELNSAETDLARSTDSFWNRCVNSNNVDMFFDLVKVIVKDWDHLGAPLNSRLNRHLNNLVNRFDSLDAGYRLVRGVSMLENEQKKLKRKYESKNEPAMLKIISDDLSHISHWKKQLS